MANEIKLILTIDDMQTALKLKGTDASIINIQNSLTQLQKNPAIKALTNDLSTLDKVTVESADAVLEFAKSYGLSEKQLQSMTNTLRLSQQVLSVGTKEYDANVKAINNVNGALSLLAQRNAASGNAVAQTRLGMGSFNSVIGQTSFLLSDMDMFFVNWRMGLMSVGNNISMVTSTIGYAMNDAKAQGKSFGQAMKESLTGFNLWILGINAGLFVITALSRLLKDSSDSANSLSSSFGQLVKIKSEFDGKTFEITSKNINQVISVIDQKIKDLSEKSEQKQIEYGMKTGVSGQSMDSRLFTSQLNDEEKKREKDNKSILESLIKQKSELEAQKIIYDAMKSAGLPLVSSTKGKEVNTPKIGSGNTHEKALYDDLHEYAEKQIELGKERDKEIIQSAEDRVAVEDMMNKKSKDNAIKNSEDIANVMRDSAGVVVDDLNNKYEHQQQLIERLSHTLSSMFSSAIRQGKTFADVLSDLGSMILEMGLQATIRGLFSLLPGGGGFMSGFLGALGIKQNANGGVLSEPILGMGRSGQLYSFAEQGIPEVVLPMNRFSNGNYGSGGTVIHEVRVTGELTGDGRTLRAVLRRLDKLEGMK